MTTPVMEEANMARGEIIGLWRNGRTDGEPDQPRRARLFALDELGFPSATGRLEFGKGPLADVQIDGDVLISRRHFALVSEDGEVWIEDLNSRNGTRINGIPLRQRERLEVGMRILCGKTELTAVSHSLKLRIEAGSYQSYLRNAAVAYGSARAAAPMVGRAHTTFGRAKKI